MKPESPPRITVSATGRKALGLVALLLVGLFAVPRLLTAPMPVEEAVALVRDLRARQVTDRYVRLLGQAADSAAPLVAMAGELEGIRTGRVVEARVRRAWVGPPFAVRWTHVVRVRFEGESAPSVYRIRRGIATAAPALWWSVPLF